MRDSMPKLLDVVFAAWARSLPPPYGDGEFSSAKDGATDCNRFVNQVAELGADYLRFRGLRANEITALIASSPDWFEVDGRTAQSHANAGALVVASWHNPDEKLHGHVCVVVPGTTQKSGRWADADCPRVANVSTPDRCFIGRTSNWAFSELPKYYLLKSTMEENS